eukprot:2821210-Rhodomonas_salina.3
MQRGCELRDSAPKRTGRSTEQTHIPDRSSIRRSIAGARYHARSEREIAQCRRRQTPQADSGVYRDGIPAVVCLKFGAKAVPASARAAVSVLRASGTEIGWQTK